MSPQRATSQPTPAEPTPAQPPVVEPTPAEQTLTTPVTPPVNDVTAAEQKKKRGTAVRVFVYVAVTHLWAALLIAMFAIGRR
ncbi:DUF6126 family protein [Peterkaempfera bronchialis]|uniref:DUF6126 family protein n=1 Tax=Peterkaempfera bronchialis TaxID=2126346 RepID=UPI0013B442C1|nr:DUF6126 family protein [Peterkaempfera bronchialis]